MCELLHCEHAALFEVDHAERKLIGKYCESGGGNWKLPLDKGIIGYAARQNALGNVQRAYDDPRFYSSTDTITGIPSREILCIPLVQELQPGQPHSVFPVLQAWNTTHQKPFTSNDQILGGLLTIQAGTVFLQTKVAKTLQKISNNLLQIIHMHRGIVQDESMISGASEGSNSSTRASGSSPSAFISSPMPVAHLVANAQKRFSDCIGIKKLKIFVLDSEVMKIWHVGSETDANGQALLVRKYSSILSSLCGLILKSSTGVVLEDPISEATFNDTVDLKGGTCGEELVSVYWHQVRRSRCRPGLRSRSSKREAGGSEKRRERNPTPLSSSPQHAPDNLAVEKDAARRASYTATIIQSHAESCSRDARRVVSSAGASRKGVTFHTRLDSATPPPDTLHVEREEEESVEPLESADDPEGDGASSSGGDGNGNDQPDADAIISAPDALGLELAQDSAAEDVRGLEAEESWQQDQQDEEQREAEIAADDTEAEQSDVDCGQQAEGDECDRADPWQSQPQVDGEWREETLEHAEHDNTGGEWKQQDEHSAEGGSWIDGGQGEDHNHNLERDSELQDGEDPFWQEEQEPSPLDNVDAGHEWQEGADTEENSLWRGESEGSSVQSPVGLISTDSMYAIDLNYSDGSPVEVTNAGGSDSFSPVDGQPGDNASLFEI